MKKPNEHLYSMGEARPEGFPPEGAATQMNALHQKCPPEPAQIPAPPLAVVAGGAPTPPRAGGPEAQARPRRQRSTRMPLGRVAIASAEPRRGRAAAQTLQIDIPRPAHPVMGRAEFLAALQRETRRAERSEAPLTLMLFRLDLAQPGQLAAWKQLVEQIDAGKRETDYLGQLDDGVLAVLFPGADRAGTRRFAEWIAERSSAVLFTTATATYPDQLFDDLSEGIRQPVAFRLPDIAAVKESGTRGYPLKRVLDIVGALAGLFLFLPLMLATAVAVKATSRGPVIFRQTRLGKGGRPFVFYKFRSMETQAGDDIHRKFVKRLIENRQDAGAEGSEGVYKMKSDPRITPVGRWIRKLSIDELPQFANVLKGDMSLVGPRPPIPYEAESYQAWHLRRVLDMKPGITGLWQVEGRSRVSFDDMVRMDIHYIRHCSLRLDLSILLRTVKVVLRGIGAS